ISYALPIAFHLIFSVFIYQFTRASTTTLFPYTTLFRSRRGACEADQRHRADRDRARGRPGLQGRRAAGRHAGDPHPPARTGELQDRKSTRLNSSHVKISYAVFCLKKKNTQV